MTHVAPWSRRTIQDSVSLITSLAAMPKRKRGSDKLDSIEEAGSLLLAVVCGVSVGSVFASAAYVLAQVAAGRGVGVAGAVIAFPVGFIAGLVAYKFRWLLRSMFD